MRCRGFFCWWSRHPPTRKAFEGEVVLVPPVPFPVVGRPDLILCDVMMPGLDGYEVLATLRADPVLSHTPFIFLTAKGEKKRPPPGHGQRGR